MDIGKALTDVATGAIGGIALGPAGMVAGAVMSAMPDLLQLFAPHLGGARGEQVAQAVVQAVSAATGAEKPTAADVAALPPAQMIDLRGQLAQIAVQAAAAKAAAEKDERDAAEAELQARLADVAGARAMAVTLAADHSALAYGAAAVSVIVILAFASTVWAAFTQVIRPESAQLLNTLLGGLSAMAMGVVSYWTGSSSGSNAKDAYIANSVPVSALGVPPGHLALPPAKAPAARAAGR